MWVFTWSLGSAFNRALFGLEWKDALWVRFYMGAPAATGYIRIEQMMRKLKRVAPSFGENREKLPLHRHNCVEFILIKLVNIA